MLCDSTRASISEVRTLVAIWVSDTIGESLRCWTPKGRWRVKPQLIPHRPRRSHRRGRNGAVHDDVARGFPVRRREVEPAGITYTAVVRTLDGRPANGSGVMAWTIPKRATSGRKARIEWDQNGKGGRGQVSYGSHIDVSSSDQISSDVPAFANC